MGGGKKSEKKTRRTRRDGGQKNRVKKRWRKGGSLRDRVLELMALAMICHPKIRVSSRRRDGDDIVEIWYTTGRYLGYSKAKQYGRILPAGKLK